VSRDGLTSAQLLRGRCYRTDSTLFSTGYRIIRIVGMGPRYVRYEGWRGDRYDHGVKRHPRVLFDSWDGSWHEVEDPSTGTVT
jgi:hypothetical protein